MSFSPRRDPRLQMSTPLEKVPEDDDVDLEFVEDGEEDGDGDADDDDEGSTNGKVDPSKLLITSEGELDPQLLVRREGWLWKKGGAINVSKFAGRRNWKYRWFELTPIQLFGKTAYEIQYWESEKKKKHLGSVALNEVEIFRESRSKKQEERHEFQLLLQHGKTFQLAAETDEERDEWVETLNIVIAYIKKLSVTAGLILGVDGYDPNNEDVPAVYKKGDTFALSCQAFGAGLFGTEAGQKGKFAIVLRDSNGDQLTKGGMPITISIHNKECLYYLRVNDHLNGTYSAHYVLAKPDSYKMHIRINDEHDIFGSPFDLTVLPSRTVPVRCAAEGYALKEVFAGGLINTFTIVARDDFSNHKSRGGEPFEVGVIGPAQLRKLTDNGDGTYECSFDVEDPADLGYYTSSSIMLMVTLHGKHINGSPFKPSIVEFVPHLHSHLVSTDDEDVDKTHFAHQFNPDLGLNFTGPKNDTKNRRKSVLNHPSPTKATLGPADFSQSGGLGNIGIESFDFADRSSVGPGAGRKGKQPLQTTKRLSINSDSGMVDPSEQMQAVPTMHSKNQYEKLSKANVDSPRRASTMPVGNGRTNDDTHIPQSAGARSVPVKIDYSSVMTDEALASTSGMSRLERARHRAMLAKQAKEAAYMSQPTEDPYASTPYSNGMGAYESYHEDSMANLSKQRRTSQMSTDSTMDRRVSALGSSMLADELNGAEDSTFTPIPAVPTKPVSKSPTLADASGSPASVGDRLSRLESLNQGPRSNSETMKKITGAQERLRQVKEQRQLQQKLGEEIGSRPIVDTNSEHSQESVSSQPVRPRRSMYDPAVTASELKKGLIGNMPPNFGPWEQNMWTSTNNAIKDPQVLPMIVANLAPLRGIFDIVARDMDNTKVIPLSTQANDQGGALRVMELYDICTLIPKREAKMSFSVVLAAQRNASTSANVAGGGVGLDFTHFVKLLILLAVHCNNKHAKMAAAHPTNAAKVECMLFNWGLGDPEKLNFLSKRLAR